MSQLTMSVYLILVLIVWAKAEIKDAAEASSFHPTKTNNLPTAFSYVSFVRHIVPKRVENVKDHKEPPSHTTIKHSTMRPEDENMFNSHTRTVPQTKSIQAPYIPFRHEVKQQQTLPYFSNSLRPTANTYRPIYPTTYAEPIYIQSRIPLAPKYGGPNPGNNPMVIGVQQPAYVRKYAHQVGAFHPILVRKTLSYAPKLNYVPHVYQRV